MRKQGEIPQPLSKYVPNSSASPYRDQEDSLDDEQLSRQFQHLTHLPQSYQLTFKKEAQQQYFMRQGNTAVNRVLFSSSQHLLEHLRPPLKWFHQQPLQELSRLPFADLMSLSLPEMLKEKVALVGEILEVKRMRLKLSSVGVNLKCLKVQQQLSHQDKNRLFLLDLLWKQLSKKIFLELLKLNLAQNKYNRLYSHIQSQMQAPIRQEVQEEAQREAHHLSQQFLQDDEDDSQAEQQSGMWQKQQQPQEESSESDENLQEKMMILTHAMAHAIQKLLFFGFNRIRKSPPLHHPKECESIPLISRHNITENSQEDDPPLPQQSQSEISYSKLQQLNNFIEALHEECANSQNILQKYFIKWKISLLEAVAQSVLHKIRANSMLPQQEQQAEEQQTQHHNHSFRGESIQIDEEQMAEQYNKQSRYTSQLSQDGSLKSQKRLLKEFLMQNNIRLFFYRLKNIWEVKKIISICVEMRRNNILHKAFVALHHHANDQQFSRKMQGYYEQMANEQFQDEGTSKLFHKTNLLFSAFQRLKDNHRTSRLFRVISSAFIKLIFRKMRSFGVEEKHQEELVEKHRMRAQKKLAFKCFSVWKQAYLNENCLTDRFRLHQARKDRETLHYCFSILKLQFKKGLIKERRAENYHHQRLVFNVFMSLKCLYENTRELKERTDTVESYLLFSKSNIFIGKLREYYRDYTAYQRFAIKEDKLRRTLVRLHALQCVKHWRRKHLSKQAYRAIQMKLIRFKNKQRKREILGKWLERTQQVLHSSTPSTPSQNHKDWLVKYYGDLCSVLP